MSILSAVGAGGMDEVSRARDPKLVVMSRGRSCLLHSPPTLIGSRGSAVKRRSLLHWTISTFAIYGQDDANRYPFFVPELIDRETLADRIAKGPLHVDKAPGIAARRSS